MFAFGVKLILSDHVGDLNSGQGGRCGSERLEPFHLTRQTLDEAVVLFNDVVQIFRLDDFDAQRDAEQVEKIVHRVQSRFVGPTLVDDDTIGHAVRAECFPEEVVSVG